MQSWICIIPTWHPHPSPLLVWPQEQVKQSEMPAKAIIFLVQSNEPHVILKWERIDLNLPILSLQRFWDSVSYFNVFQVYHLYHPCKWFLPCPSQRSFISMRFTNWCESSRFQHGFRLWKEASSSGRVQKPLQKNDLIFKIYPKNQGIRSITQVLPFPSPSYPSNIIQPGWFFSSPRHFITGEPTIPEPRGAGISRARTEPHLPWTWKKRLKLGAKKKRSWQIDKKLMG